MKRIEILIALMFLVVCGCTHSNGGSQKKGSSGKTLEVLLVANKNVYTGDTKTLIDSLFRRPQVGLPQAEPMFDVVNIPVSSFKNSEMFQVHRNVILCEIDSANPDKTYMYIDKWSAPQVVFEFAATSHRTLDSMIAAQSPRIINEMHNADYRRIAKAFKGTAGYELIEKIYQQFGFRLMLSNEFELTTPPNPNPDFAWIRKEAKDFGIGVLIHVFDYTDPAVFEQDNILDRLDEIMRQHVHGPTDSSYMGTERRLDFHSRVIDFNDCQYAVETRGCWRLYGDYMGGPFVNYTLLDPQGKRIIMLTGYVYCPRFNKRDYLMQVDGICHSLSFDN